MSWAFQPLLPGAAQLQAAGGAQLVTPTTTALVLATFAPTVTATAHQTVTPTTASLVLTTFAPSVTLGFNVVPTTAALTLAMFAPTVTVAPAPPVAFVQRVLGTAGWGTTRTVAITPTAGSALVVVGYMDGNPQPLPSIADDKSNSWTISASTRNQNRPADYSGSGSADGQFFTATAFNVAAGATTITCTFSSGDWLILEAYEVSGAAAVQGAAADHPAAGTSFATPSLVTTGTTFVLGMIGIRASDPSTATSGYTQSPAVINVDSVAYGRSAYQVIGAGTQAITWTTGASHTPGTGILALEAAASVTVTPGVASLTLTTFAPSVTASDHQTVTPTTASLATATFAPTVTASDHKTVVPATANLATATFAPTVTASNHQTVTPGTASLTLTVFAPTVSTTANQLVTPGVASLTLATFAPTVTATDHKTVVPGVASLTLATFAPTVTASDHKTVTPTTAALTLATFAPTVTGGASYYLDATNGNNAAAGTSSGAPWQTLAKMAATQLAPGDFVYLKRGEVWAEADVWTNKWSGTAGNPVTFDAYGTGARPRIDGTGGVDYLLYLDVSGATNKGDITFRNIVFSDGPLRNLVLNGFTGYVTFDTCDFYGSGDGGAVGKPGTLNLSNCSGGGLVTGCTFHDTSNDGVYLWNSPNVEFASCDFRTIDGTTSDCIQFTGNTTNRSSGWHVHDCAFDMTSTTSPKGCVISEQGDLGGTFEDNTTTGGISGLSATSSGVVCRRNVMRNHNTQTYAGGVYCEPQANVTGLDIQNNVMVDCNYGIVVFAVSTYTCTSATIAHNTIVRPTARGIFLEAPFGGTIRDNIVSGTPTSEMLRLSTISGSATSNYNDFSGGASFNWAGTAYASLALYQAGTGQETNSTTGDPDLDASFAPRVGSAPVDAASDGTNMGARQYEWTAVTPTTASLVLATFAPSVTANANQTVTPSAASLALTAFAPNVVATDHKTVTPGVAALTLTAFAPVVSATAHQTVTPGVATLTLTAFAPLVTGGAGLTVVPGLATLTLATFAPTVALSANQTVTPTTLALSMTAFAPNVVLTDHKLVTPDPAALALALFAPTVTASNHQTVTPGTLALTLATFAPTVGQAVYIGGFPPIAAAVSFALRLTGRGDRPSGGASNPTPGGDASNPKPGA